MSLIVFISENYALLWEILIWILLFHYILPNILHNLILLLNLSQQTFSELLISIYDLLAIIELFYRFLDNFILFQQPLGSIFNKLIRFLSLWIFLLAMMTFIALFRNSFLSTVLADDFITALSNRELLFMLKTNYTIENCILIDVLFNHFHWVAKI